MYRNEYPDTLAQKNAFPRFVFLDNTSVHMPSIIKLFFFKKEESGKSSIGHTTAPIRLIFRLVSKEGVQNEQNSIDQETIQELYDSIPDQLK